MRTFGSYEATREIARTAFGQVWRARKIGEEDERFAIKAIDCGELSFVADDAIVAGRLDAFLDAAKAQGAAGEGWARVHQTGRLSDSAYVVMDALPLSVARLVEGRSAISAHVLVSLTNGLCAALRSSRDGAKRWHGNLKGSNVFFDRDSELQEAKVIVTDPASTKELGADKGEVADLHAIGELIYQLVVHRPFTALGGWPVPAGKEWDRLGKVGSGWRELCSELLNPELKPGQITLEQIAERATALTPAPRPVMLYALAAFAVLAIIVGGLFAWQNRPWKPLEWNSSLWTEVCDNSEWYSMVIEGVLAGETDETMQAFKGKVLVSGSEREGLLAATPDLTQIDPELAGVVRAHLAAFGSEDIDAQTWDRFRERYPDVFENGDIKRAVGDLSNDKTRPPWMLGDARRVTAALGSKIMYQTPDFAQFRVQPPDGDQNAISKASYGLYFARFMQAELQRAIEAQIATLRDRVVKEGGSPVPAPRASEEIRLALERGALWESSDRTTAERLIALAGVGRDAARLQAGWTTITESVAQLEGSAGSGDSVIQSALASATSSISAIDADEGLLSVIESVERWAKLFRASATLVAERGEKEIDWGVLSARTGLSDVYDASREGPLTAAQFDLWLAGIQDEGYWKITDPRPAFTAGSELESAQRVLASIDSVERELSEDEIGSIEQEIAAIRARVLKAEELAWIRRHREMVMAEASATRTDAERAHDSARDLVANIATSATEQIQRWMAEDISAMTSVVAIREKWASTRQAMSVRLDPSAGGSPSQLRAALRNARRVLLWDEDARTGQATTDGWAKKLEAWGADSPADRPSSWDEGAWANAVQARREAMARSLIRSIEGWDSTSRLDRWAKFDEVRSAEDRVWEEAETWASRSGQMAIDFARVETLRDWWFGFEEISPDNGETIRAIVERWIGDEMMAESIRAVAIVASDAARLRSIPGSLRAERVRLATEPSEAGWARFAAWRSLGTATPAEAWPASADELAKELAARSDLTAEARSIPDVARRQAVADEIESTGPARWSLAMLHGGTADLDAVMGARDRMGVTSGAPGVDPRAAVNIALYEFVASVRGQEEDAAKAIGSAMVAKVQTLMPAVGERPELTASLQKVKEAIDGEAPRKPLTQLLRENGPGKHADFRVQSTSGGQDEYSAPVTITYVNKQSMALQFVRVNDSETEPVYVCTEELSVGNVSALLAIYPGGVRRAGRTWYQLEAENDPEGVITWELKGSRIVPFAAAASGWWSVDNVGAAEAFPAGMTPPGPPTTDSPVQWIEPLMIEGLADTIGCRLPTSEEWKLALARERRESGSQSGAIGANLRDATFTAFTAHVADLRQRSTVRSLEFPHRGSYDAGDLKGAAVAEGATSANDGSLWFEPPSHPGRGVVFKHMIGNVAEFVNDTPGAKSGYGIVGGSAMSASPSVETVTPAKSESVFADVGGRLAFSLKDLKPPMWVALLSALGESIPYQFIAKAGD